MQTFKVLKWPLYLAVFLILGCSSLHVDVVPAVDWSAVSVVELQEPAHDPWLLTAAIRTQLHQMGLTVAAKENASPDLLVRYFVQEGPDLNADGDLLTRLKSLHIQFVDPSTDQYVAVADYFYPDSDYEPVDGVVAAFSGLQQDIQTAGSKQVEPVPPPAPSSSVDSATEAPQQQPVAAEAGEQPPRANQNPGTEDPAQPAVESAAGLPPSTQQPSATVAPATEKDSIRKVAPKTRSPWVPRFESWGFENWGEQHDDGY